MRTIPLFRASAGKEELNAVKKVFASGFLGKWIFTEKFEKDFARYVGAKYAVGTNSGTAALHLALMACGVGEGDEVLVPSLTFCSTALVVLYVGATPVWVDVDRETLCMDPDDAAKKITSRTAAIIPVHYGGTPADMKKIRSILRRDAPRACVIEDAAQACGARYDSGERVGCCKWSDATCFSFESKKPATSGQAGAVVTNKKDIAERVERLSWLGITKGTKERMKKGKYNWKYDVVDVNGYYGMKYHLSDIEAAILNVQIKKLDRMNARRRRIVERYNRAFKSVPLIRIVRRADGSACWNYAIILKGVNREDFIDHLTKNGVSAGVHYELLNRHTVFKNHREARTPDADDVWKRLVILPCFPDLAKKQQDYVIKCVKEFGG